MKFAVAAVRALSYRVEAFSSIPTPSTYFMLRYTAFLILEYNLNTNFNIYTFSKSYNYVLKTKIYIL